MRTPHSYDQNFSVGGDTLLPKATLPRAMNRTKNIPPIPISPSLGEFMMAVENKLSRILGEDLPPGASDPQVLIDAARYLCLSDNAKRFRPQLTFLYGQAVGADIWDLVDIAAASELIHAASLLHDDIVDESPLRRGRPTVNDKWGNKVAVLAGDLVLSLAFFLLKRYPPQVHGSAVDVVTAMSRAAMIEVEVRGSINHQTSRWRSVAEGKTGMLFAWPGKSVGYLQDDPEAVRRFAKCGEHLGVAFQIADDYKDVQGGDKTKEKYADIRNCNPSFPIIQAAQISESLRNRIDVLWKNGQISDAEVQSLGDEIASSEAMDITWNHLEKEVNSAIESLGPYRDKPGGIEIVHWAKFLLNSLEPGRKNC